MSTAGNYYPRFIQTFLNREASQATQVAVGRVTVGIVVSLALLVGLASGDLLVLLGGSRILRISNVARPTRHLLFTLFHW